MRFAAVYRAPRVRARARCRDGEKRRARARARVCVRVDKKAARRRRAVLEGRPFNHLVDVWSVGVITFILLGGYAPFHASDVHQLFTKIRKCDLHFNPKYWDKISDDAKDFIKQMLTRDPARRADAAQARRRRAAARARDALFRTPPRSRERGAAALARVAQPRAHDAQGPRHRTPLPEMAGWRAPPQRQRRRAPAGREAPVGQGADVRPRPRRDQEPQERGSRAREAGRRRPERSGRRRHRPVGPLSRRPRSVERRGARVSLIVPREAQ